MKSLDLRSIVPACIVVTVAAVAGALLGVNMIAFVAAMSLGIAILFFVIRTVWDRLTKLDSGGETKDRYDDSRRRHDDDTIFSPSPTDNIFTDHTPGSPF